MQKVALLKTKLNADYGCPSQEKNPNHFSFH